MTNSLKVKAGDPIYVHNRSELVIAGFWADDHSFIEPRFTFETISQILGEKDEPSAVTYFNGRWKLVPGSRQEDLAGSPFFVVHEASGPRAVYNALRVLLNDEPFLVYATGQTIDSLSAYMEIARHKAGIQK